MGFLSKIFNKKTDEIKSEKVIEYEYSVENASQSQLEKIYNTEFSIVDIYLKPYKNNTAIKVLKLDNDNIIGDVASKDINELLELNFRTGQIYVDFYLDDNGKKLYRGVISFKRKIKI